MNVLDLITIEEGFREKPYYCSENYPTIGIGKRIGPKGADLSLYEFTVNEALARLWLHDEVYIIKSELNKRDWFCGLTSGRQAVIISMAYQLGINGLLKFKKMIAAIEREHWNEAAGQALDSKWQKQTPKRALRHAQVIVTGTTKEAYQNV